MRLFTAALIRLFHIRLNTLCTRGREELQVEFQRIKAINGTVNLTEKRLRVSVWRRQGNPDANRALSGFSA